MKTTIEMVTFKTLNKFDKQHFDTIQNEINDFCLQQPGFIYRSLSQDDKQVWHDIVYWQSMELAKTAGEQFGQYPVCKKLATVIDLTSVQVSHMQASTELMATP